MRRHAAVCLLACLLAGDARVGANDTEAAPEALGLKIYANELDPPVFKRVVYGYDRDAVCATGTCSNGSACATNLACAGIGDGLCHYTACSGDFAPNCSPPNNICGVLVESLTPAAAVGQTIWQLVCNPVTPGGSDCQVGASLPPTTVSWDFSEVNLTNFPGLVRTASTFTPIDSAETPNWNQCGFNEPGSLLGREDKNWPTPASTVHTLNSLERENGIKVCMNGSAATNGKICASNADCGGGGTCVTTATIWLRGAVRYEGVSGGLGQGESRLCHVGGGRTQVPLWRFPNQDSQGQFMRLGDPRWEHTAFACENAITFPASVFIYACSGYEGRQTGQVVNEGVVELPSGHKFESLVVRTNAEYCVAFGGCFFSIDNVRTVLYLWEVPHLGTVVRLQSNKVAVNTRDFTHLSEIDVKYGLFPPLALTVGTVTDTTVDLSWDPGLITDHINGYRIYWDTESGGRCNVGGENCNAAHPGAGNCPAGFVCCSLPGDTCDGYDFDSVTHPAQVSFPTATSASVSGLTPGTSYFFTVTARSSFIDPATLVATAYESVLYPTRIPAVPLDLPLEVAATTAAACTPSLEVQNLTMGKSGSQLVTCWDPVADPCIEGYRVRAALAPQSAASFSIIESETGLASCTSYTADGNFFLVVGRKGAAEGPWGHFGQ